MPRHLQPPAVVPAATASGSGQPLAMPSASASVSIPPPNASASASVPSPSARPIPTAVPSAPVSSAPPVREGAPPIGQGPSRAWNALYLEGGGAAILWSINYELHPVSFLSLRAGYGAFRFTVSCHTAYNDCPIVHFVPITASVLVGQQASRLEVGGGVTVVRSGNATFGTLAIGYRYQLESAGPLLRVVFTPLLFVGESVGVFPSAGLAFGATF